jgi:SAM-dependent methyltransferase
MMPGYPTARTGSEVGLATHVRNITESLGDKQAIILDVGCGTGAYVAKLIAMNSKYQGVGIDINPFFVRDRRSNSADLIVAASEFLPLRQGAVDMAIMIESLEHVKDEDKTLKEINGAIRAGGVIYVSVPNRFYPLESHGIKIRNWISERMFPIGVPLFPFIPRRLVRSLVRARTYTRREICRLLSRQNWKITGLVLVAPPIDRQMGTGLARSLRRLMKAVESTFVLEEFGSSIVVTAARTHA